MNETRVNRAARETFLTTILLRALTRGETWLTVEGCVYTPNGAPHGGATCVGAVTVRGESGVRTVTPTDLAVAYRAVLDTGESTGLTESRRRVLLDARRHNDVGAVDYRDADVLLQLALLGEWRHR